MEQTIKINVTISKYVYGQGKQYTSDIGQMIIEATMLADRVELQGAIDNYCEELAGDVMPYDTDLEDYLLEFWHDDKRIKRVFLGDYADYFGRNL